MEENFLELFFKNSPNAYSLCKLVFDEKGIPYDYEILEINESYEKLMSVKAYDVINKRGSEIYKDSFWVGNSYLSVKNALLNNTVTELDVRNPINNKWFRFKVFPLNKEAFACIIIDVTKEYIQERQIEWFLNSNLDILYVWDFETNTYRVNKKFENVVGYKLEEIKDNTPLSLVLEDDLQPSLLVMEGLKEHKSTEKFVNRFKCKDGTVRHFEWQCESYGNYACFSGRDITENYREKTELFIKRQLDWVNTINVIDNLEVGYVRYSYPDFNIIDMNNKAYSTLKLIEPSVGSISSIIGRNGFEIFKSSKSKEIKMKKYIKRIVDKKLDYFFDNIKIKLDGKERFVKSIFQPILGLNNEVVEIVSISVDITEETKEKKEMMKTIKIQEELLANISHELKTPLNVIFSQNQLLELYIKNGLFENNMEKVTRGIHIIKQNCYRLTKLINNIVDLSKIKSGFYELNQSNENIVKIIEEIVQSVSEYVKEKGLSITFNTNIKEKIIVCDPEKIERIMLNLISNAMKFTNPGGSIFVNIYDKGDSVEINVQDTGVGIEEKYLTKIFDKFQQVDKSLCRNAEGSGIGLSVVKSFTKLHGGKVSVESEVGKGSTFKIKLPARTMENEKNKKKTSQIDYRIQMINVEFSDIYSI